jgi:RHH-type rel operon transcriptional repressor/antitoxin RelB
MLALRLPPEIEARLDALAKRTGRSKSFYARQAILEHLDDMEDIFLAEKRLEELRKGETDTVPLSELMTRYGVEN